MATQSNTTAATDTRTGSAPPIFGNMVLQVRSAKTLRTKPKTEGAAPKKYVRLEVAAVLVSSEKLLSPHTTAVVFEDAMARLGTRRFRAGDTLHVYAMKQGGIKVIDKPRANNGRSDKRRDTGREMGRTPVETPVAQVVTGRPTPAAPPAAMAAAAPAAASYEDQLTAF